MSLPDSATLTFDVRGRRSERRLGVLALVAVAAAIGLLPLPLLSAVLFFAIAAAVVVLGLWGQGWLGGAGRLTAVSWLSDGSWLLTSTNRKNISCLVIDRLTHRQRLVVASLAHRSRRSLDADLEGRRTTCGISPLQRASATGISLRRARSDSFYRCVTMIFEDRHAIAQRVFRNAYVAANFRAAHQSMRAVVALPMSALPPAGQGAGA